MPKKSWIKIIFAGLVFCLILILFLYLPTPKELSPQPKAARGNFDLPLIGQNDNFFDREQFLQAARMAEDITPRADIRAVIVPHHLVGSEIIAALIKMSSGRPIDTVVVIGPNHNNIGREPMASALANWQTQAGELAAAAQLSEQFLADHRLQANQSSLENEHSIGAIAPFIKHYLPQARILPIVLSSYAGRAEAEKLSDWLKNNYDEKILIIFSFDFSHYLTKEDADLKDEETENLIENLLIDKAYALNNDYVDSPAGLATALLLAQKSSYKVSIVRHGNSFDYATKKPSATTSYFGIIFTNE